MGSIYSRIPILGELEKFKGYKIMYLRYSLISLSHISGYSGNKATVSLWVTSHIKFCYNKMAGSTATTDQSHHPMWTFISSANY